MATDSSVKQIILWTLFAIVLYVVFTFINLPVTILHPIITQSAQQHDIKATNLSGSIFKGSSDIKLPQLSFTVEWRLCAINIFNPIGICLRAHNNAFDLTIDASAWLLSSATAWKLHNIYGTIDIDSIMPMFPLPTHIKKYLGNVIPQGKIKISIDDLALALHKKNIIIKDWQGKIALQKLRVAEYHLGSYILTLSSNEKKGHIKPIVNMKGGDPTLKIKAKLSLHEDSYTISSQLTTNNPMLSSMLSMVTTTTGKNAFSYKRVSSLPWNLGSR